MLRSVVVAGDGNVRSAPPREQAEAFYDLLGFCCSLLAVVTDERGIDAADVLEDQWRIYEVSRRHAGMEG